MKAFVNIGTACGVADGVQPQSAQLGLEVMNGFESSLGLAEP